MASPFFGGPERQVLGLARAMRPKSVTRFYSFREGGAADDFLNRARSAGFDAVPLEANWPNFRACRDEIADRLRRDSIDLLITNGYKPDILGLAGARKAGIPAVAIAHGWTAATWKVRLNEWLDKQAMKRFDRVVGVSDKQSERVIRAGVAKERVVTIHNGISPDELAQRNADHRAALLRYFDSPPEVVFIAAGRLSPEKGFDVLIDAVDRMETRVPFGVLIFGAGPLEAALRERIQRGHIADKVVLGGFCDSLDRLLPQADGFVMSSRTEGLPVIMLESMAAGLPGVVTPVGGIPEVMEHEQNGIHCPVDDPDLLAKRLEDLVASPALRARLGEAAEKTIRSRFTHEHQAHEFQRLADLLVNLNGGT
ncbi:MAG: glycosyltransferase family 4 protein [Planctomycetota bacterium]